MIELTLLLRFHLQHCSHNSTRNFAKLDLRNVNCDSMCGLSHFRINYALSGNRTWFLNTYRLNGLYTPSVRRDTRFKSDMIV